MWRRRGRTRKFVLALPICFILYVSYKILETEITGKNFSDKEIREMSKLNVKHHIEGQNTFRDHLHNETGDVNRDDVIGELIKKYKVKVVPIKQSPWVIAKNWVTTRHVHPEYTPELGAVLNAMATRKIISADTGYKGTQLKLTLTLLGGQRVVFKPKWFDRSHVVDGSIYAGPDRHNGQIAAFHLGRILDFRRTPFSVGRVINLETEIEPVAKKQLTDTFYRQGNSTCFYGKCYYCKGESSGVCADGILMEGAIDLWLPEHYSLKQHRHPWARTYKAGKLAKWEVDSDYCNSTVGKMPVYTEGPRLMDLVDTTIFDYLIQNGDRHHYETLQDDTTSMFLILDNGKSFGKPHMDDKSILAPLVQCCRLREGTWLRLLVLQDGILSAVLKSVLSTDPIAPILTDPHLEALDRRLKHILTEVNKCILQFGMRKVFVNDR